jgi:hypothetical protein
LLAVTPRLLADLSTRPMVSVTTGTIDSGAIAVTQYANERPLLWTTDGTQKGTRKVGRVFEGASDITAIKSAGGFAIATGLVNGGPNRDYFSGLWATDGTAAGTHFLRSAYGMSGFSQLAVERGRVWWVEGSYLSSSLWTSDGTVAGTRIVKDLGAPDVVGLTAIDGVAFVQMQDGVWLSNGKASGTRRVLGEEYSLSPGAKVIDGKAYHTDYRSSERRLISLDRAGKVADCGAWSLASEPMTLGGRQVVMAWPETGNYDSPAFGLYEIDGSKLRLIVEKAEFNEPGSIAVLNGVGYFTIASQVWRTDGTAKGTKRLATLGEYVHKLTPSRDALIVAGSELDQGRLWRLAPDGATTVLSTSLEVTNFDSGYVHVSPTRSTGAGRTVFAGGDEMGQLQLCSTDGTFAGTISLTSTPGGPEVHSRPSSFARVGQEVVFVTSTTGSTTADQTTLWATDGIAPPRRVATLQGSSSPTFERRMVMSLDDRRALWSVEVRTAGSSSGNYVPKRSDLYVVDVVSGQTTLLKEDVQPSFLGNTRSGLAYFSTNADFYDVYDDGNTAIWRTDGTVAGTSAIMEYDRTKGPSRVEGVVVNGRLVAHVYNLSNNGSVVSLDGTREGRITYDFAPAGRVVTKLSTPVAYRGETYVSYITVLDAMSRMDERRHVARLNADGSITAVFEAPAYAANVSLSATESYMWFGSTADASGTTVYRSDGTPRGTRRVATSAGLYGPDNVYEVQGIAFVRSLGGEPEFTYDLESRRVDWSERYVEESSVGTAAMLADEGSTGARIGGRFVYSGLQSPVQAFDDAYDGEPYVLDLAATIRGAVFSDANADGIRNADEPGLPGVPVFIDANDNGSLDRGEESVIANRSGRYAFSGLARGTYAVRAVSAGLTVDVAIATVRGTQVRVRDFGVRSGATLTGRVFVDTDRDGLRDPSESASAAFQIFIDDNENGVYDVGELWTITQNDNSYAFCGLTKGSYTVRVKLPKSQKATTPVSVRRDVPRTGTRIVDFGLRPIA